MKNHCKKSKERAVAFTELTKDQAERIRELKKENENLLRELDEYREKESEISQTLADIKKREEEFKSEIKVKYALECEKLAAFRKKWTEAAFNGVLKGDCERTARTLRECQAAMERGLCDDLGTEDYFSERERLDGEPSLNYEAIIAEGKNSPDDISDVTLAMRNKDKLSESELAELISQL